MAAASRNVYSLLKDAAINFLVMAPQKANCPPMVINGKWNPAFLAFAFKDITSPPTAPVINPIFQPLVDLVMSSLAPAISTTNPNFQPVVAGGSGISSMAIYDKDTQSYIITNSATELNAGFNVELETVGADVQISLLPDPNIPDTFYGNALADAKVFLNSFQAAFPTVSNSQISGLGLSLGGYVTTDALASIGDTNVTTFESPQHGTILGSLASLFSFGSITTSGENFIVQSDVIPSLGVMPGTAVLLGPGFDPAVPTIGSWPFGHDQDNGLAGVTHGTEYASLNLMDMATKALTAAGYSNVSQLMSDPSQAAAFLESVYPTTGGHIVWTTVINGTTYAVSPTGGDVDGVMTISAADAYSSSPFSPATVANANGAAQQATAGLQKNTSRVADLGEEVGASLGSQIGMILGGSNPLAQIAAGTVLGALGASLGQYIDYDLAGALQSIGDSASHSFGEQITASFQSTGISVVSSTLTNDIMNALGVKGFAAQIGNVVLNTAINNTISVAFGLSSPTASLLSMEGSALGSFFGSQLALLIVSPQTQAAAVLGSLASAAGAMVAAQNFALYFGSLAGPIGAFVGELLGVIIGNLFGHKKPKIPSANAATVLTLPIAQYALGAVTSTNGGSTDIVTDMATAARDALNGIIHTVVDAAGFVSNSSSPTQTYGYNGTQLFVQLGTATATNVSDANEAVNVGVLWAIKQTQMIGGNIFEKRAIANTLSNSVTGLIADIDAASDYSKYRSEWQAVNSLIAGSPNSALTAGWIITFQRSNELNLGNWSKSDFYGGIAGFLQSFGMGVVDSAAHYEDVALAWSSGNLTITDAATPGLFSALAQASTDGTNVTINNFATTMGYASAAMGTATTTNTIEVAATPTTAVNFSDAGHAGYNIFIGGNAGNTITAGTNDTWIQGGSGTDSLHGGSGHDVIIAGSGSTTIYGGSADSYLAAGSGADTITGGAGNDTIVLGAGHDVIAGGAGNDMIILSALASGNGTIDGGAGSNTLSYERYSTGVTLNLGSWASPTGTSYTISNIQNLIGSVAGDNTLQTGGTGGVLEGGAGNDIFTGVSGGTTTVTFANSGAGVLVDLSSNVSFGGSSDGDVFNNIKNVTGSGFDDELKGVAGSTLDGGMGGNDWFDYSGGGNTYVGSVNGSNTIDYSSAPAAVALNLTNDLTTFGTGQVTGHAQDKISNITRIIGSPFGSTITGLPAYTTTTVAGVTTVTATNQGIYFIADGGINTFSGGGLDTIELDRGGGQTTVSSSLNSGFETLVLGAGNTYDNLWTSKNVNVSISPIPVNPPQGYSGPTVISTVNMTWGIRGSSDQVAFVSVSNVSSSGLSSISMDGASTLDLTGIGTLIGQVQTTTGTQSTGQTITITGGGSTYTSAATVNGVTTGGSMILTGGTASVINVDGGAATANGSVVIAGRATPGGLITINTSGGDDQITFERGDGHYVINGTGGQKTIDFGPSVGSNDIFYNVVGNDLYVGIVDPANPGFTADQVSDNIRIVGGALEGIVNGAASLANPYFIEVGGTTIDLSKLNIAWKFAITASGSATISNQTFSVANALSLSVTGDNNVANVGTGDTITFNGATEVINFTANAASLTVGGNGDTTVNATGTAQTVTLGGNGTSGTAYNVAMSSAGTIILQANSRGNINGASGQNVTVGNTSSVGVSTSSSVITAGSGDGIWLGGDNETVSSTSAQIYVETANTTQTISGAGNTVTLQATGEHLTVTGSNDTITGNTSTITITGTNLTESLNSVGNTITASNGSHLTLTGDSTYGAYNYLTLSSGTLTLNANSNVTLTGTGNTITVGNNALLSLTNGSNSNTVNAGANENLWTSGTGGAFAATSSSLNINVANATESMTGAGNTIIIYQGGDTVTTGGAIINFNPANASFTLIGGGDTINILAASQTVNVGGNGSGGTADVVNMQSYVGTLNVSANSNVSLGGNGNTINLAGTDNVALSTNNSTINASGTANVIGIGGSGDTVSAASSTVNWSGTSGTLNVSGNSNVIGVGGSGDTINLTGTSDSVSVTSGTVNVKTASSSNTITGAGTTVNIQAASQTVTVGGNGKTGTADVVNMSFAGTLNVSANSNVSLGGNGSIINLAGTDNVALSTNNSTINASGTANVINIGGTGNSVNSANATINLSATSGTLTVTGTGDTINVGGTGDSITVHGTGFVVNVSNATIYEGNTSTATVNGTGNTIVHLGTAPIIFDLNDDGLELTPVSTSDIVTSASNGAMTRLGWVGPTDGILVTDRNGDGQYGSVSDISFTQDVAGAQTDLQGLAAWDTNGDGGIDANDAGWSKLKIWVDANMDGVSTPDEVKSLSDLGISSINLTRTLTGADGSQSADSYASATSTFTRADGTTGTTYDVTLGQELLTDGGWNTVEDGNDAQLSGGLLGHLVSNASNPTASDVSYTASTTVDPTLLAIWGSYMDPASDAARKAALASGQIGDTSWMQSTAVAVDDPNRGAHVTTQRLQVLDLDLTGFGPQTTDATGSGVKVDVNLTGNPYSVGWVGASDGLLVIDAVNDGNIDAATEATFQSWVPYAKTSLQGLGAFDTDGDGAIDAGDKVFTALKIWTDTNGNGVSDPGELKSLSDLGIASISLTPDSQDLDHKTLSENQVLASTTVTMTDGTTHELYDVALGVADPNASTDNNTAPTTSAASTNTTTPSLSSPVDTTGTPVVTGGLNQSLTGSVNSSTGTVTASADGSDGPSGEVVTADDSSGSSGSDWSQGASSSLSDTIDQFNSTGQSTNSQAQAPVAAANDAAMIQRHLLLRQAIAGFTVQGSAPALFSRDGSLDTQSTLAAATQTVASSTSGVTAKAA